jgi:large subunit ribosomal protein L35
MRIWIGPGPFLGTDKPHHFIEFSEQNGQDLYPFESGEKETLMPKLKTNRGAAKRFSKTGRGKIRRNKAYHSHLLTSKSPKRKRALRKRGFISKADARGVRLLIPYA